MPRRGEKKLTDFRFEVDGQNVVVRVKLIDSGRSVYFEATNEELGIRIDNVDINELKNSAGTLVRERLKRKWESYLYVRAELYESSVNYGPQQIATTIETWAVATDSTGKKSYRKTGAVDWDKNLEDMIETENFMQRTSGDDRTGPPDTGWHHVGRVYQNSMPLNFGVFIPATHENIKRVHDLVAELKEISKHLVGRVQAMDPSLDVKRQLLAPDGKPAKEYENVQ